MSPDRRRARASSTFLLNEGVDDEPIDWIFLFAYATDMALERCVVSLMRFMIR